MKGLAVLLAIIFGVAVPVWAEDPNQFAIYGVGSADPQSLTELIRAMVGPDGHVTYDERQQRLLVLAPPRTQKRIAELVQQAAPPAVNIRLEINFRQRGTLSENEFGVSGGAEIVREPGLSHTTVRIKPRVMANSMSTASDVQQVLVVASGREAALRVGEEVPWLDWVMDYGGRHDAIRLETIAWQQVGAFLAVQAVVVGGDMIRLRLIPELRGRVAGQPHAIRFTSVATEVVVAQGQPFPLAGLTQGNEFMQHFLVGRRSLAQTDALDISVTPRILR
jgi:type II secretory pathway component GspD/PulD (secretin)